MDLKPGAYMSDWCTNTSESVSALEMKPNPFATSNLQQGSYAQIVLDQAHTRVWVTTCGVCKPTLDSSYGVGCGRRLEAAGKHEVDAPLADAFYDCRIITHAWHRRDGRA